MTLTLTIVATNRRFIQSAIEVFAGYPTVRILNSWSPATRTAYVIPTDSFGTIYSPQLFPDCQEYIYTNWKKWQPLQPLQHIWCWKDDILYIAYPCLKTGLPPYTENTMTPYITMSSILKAMNTSDILHTIDTIVFPALCCEPGGLDPEASSLQMCQAWNDYNRLSPMCISCAAN